MIQTKRAAWHGGPEEDEYHRQTRYTKASPHIQEESRKWAGQRNDWIRWVMRSESLKPEEKLTLIALSLYFRGKGKTAAPSMRAWPSEEGLGEDVGRSARTIRRHLARGHEVGFIFIEGRQGGGFNDDGKWRGQTNYYYLQMPDDDDELGDDEPDDGDDVGADGGDGGDGSSVDTHDQARSVATHDHAEPCRSDHPTGKHGHVDDEDRSYREASPVTSCPHMNPSIENPPKESSNSTVIDRPVVVCDGFGGHGEVDAPFARVAADDARGFILRLLGNGDEARGKMINEASFAATTLRYDAIDGRLRPSVIRKTVTSYHERMERLAPIAIRAIQQALFKMGTQVEPSDHIPGNVLVVEVKQWRSCAYRNGIEGREFDMAFAYLVDRGDVSAWGGKVWLQQNEVDQA